MKYQLVVTDNQITGAFGVKLEPILESIAVCPVCGEPVQSDTLVAFCGHDDSRIRKCAA